MTCGYNLNHASDEFITRIGEILGECCIGEIDPTAENGSVRLEFTVNGKAQVNVSEAIAFMDFRLSLTLDLSNLARSIREWREAEKQ